MSYINTLTFKVPEDLAGKNLSQLGANLPSDWYGYSKDREGVDVGATAPLTAGQLINYRTNDPTWQGGGAYLNLQKLLGSPLTTEQKAATVADTQTNQLVKSAQALRNFNIESAQPAIKTYQAQLDTSNPNSIESRYNQILASIKGMGQTAEDQTIRALTSGLGARGLLPDSPEGQRAIQEGLLPIRSQFANILGQTGLQDPANRINEAIAQLQTGNPEASIGGGLNISSLGQNAFQFGQNLLLKQQEQEQAKREFNAKQAYQQDYLMKYLIPSLASKGIPSIQDPLGLGIFG